MKIQLLSDTHSNLDKFKPHKEADLIVHAGDFTSGVGDSIKYISEFAELCKSHNKDYVLVKGNHDYYGFIYRDEILKRLDELEINYLITGKEFKFKGWTFIGDTLFTEFNLPNYDNEFIKENAQYYLNDFTHIRYNPSSMITPQDYISEFYKQYDWINSFRNKENIFVVTHFVPSMELIHPYYADNPLNPYFLNNLDLTGFQHWAVGHSHQTLRKKVNNCNVYMNAYGYTNGIQWECPRFDTNYVIEL